jgi:hypothetical protein
MSDLGPNDYPAQRPWDTDSPPGSLPRTDGHVVIGSESDVTAHTGPDAYDEDTGGVIGSWSDEENERLVPPPPRVAGAAGRATVDETIPHSRDLDTRPRPARPAQVPAGGELRHHGRDQATTPSREEVRGDPSRPHTAEVLDEPKVVIAGGNREVRTVVTDDATNEIARRVSETGGGVVLRVRFNKSPEGGAAALAEAVDPTVANSVELPVTDPRDGPSLVGILNNRQLAETLGNTIAGDDTRAAGAYAEVVEAVADAVDKYHQQQHAAGKTETLQRRTLDEVRYGVNELRDMRDDYVTASGEREVGLEEDALELVRDCIAEPRKRALGNYIEPLGAGLDKIVRDTSVDREPRHAVVPPNGRTNKNTTVVGVTIDGFGRRRTGEIGILSHALPPLVAESTGWGQPRAIIVEDADRADQRALDELSQHADEQGIPMVWTVAAPNERNAHLLDAPAHLIMRTETRGAEQISKALGTKIGREVGSTTESYTGGSSTGAHIGKNTGYRQNQAGEDAETGGRTSSADDARNVGYTFNENIITDVPILKPNEVTSLGDKDVVARRRNEVAGVFDADSAGFVAPYPLRQRPTINAKDKIDQIAAENEEAFFLARRALAAATKAAELAAQAKGAALEAKGDAQAALTAGEELTTKKLIGTDAEGMPKMGGRLTEVGAGLTVRKGAEEQYLRMQYRDETTRSVKGDGRRDRDYQAWKSVNEAWEDYKAAAIRNGEDYVSWGRFRRHNLGY